MSVRRLHLENLKADPYHQFLEWFEEASACDEVAYPTACCLSTLGVDSYPEGRMVLLKGHGEDGFVIYTNTLSKKGRALLKTPKAALTFYWDPLGRQIRIQGNVEIVSDSEADAYFKSRQRSSQIGAWASKQSSPLKDRAELETSIANYEKQFSGSDVPRPEFWTGYLLTPTNFEFWQFGEYRLHDRFRYSPTKKNWEITRLSP